MGGVGPGGQVLKDVVVIVRWGIVIVEMFGEGGKFAEDFSGGGSRGCCELE